MTKHEEKKQAYPTTQEVHENDIVVGADPRNTNIITSQYPSVRRMVLKATYVKKTRVCKVLKIETLPRIGNNECKKEN